MKSAVTTLILTFILRKREIVYHSASAASKYCLCVLHLFMYPVVYVAPIFASFKGFSMLMTVYGMCLYIYSVCVYEVDKPCDKFLCYLYVLVDCITVFVLHL